MEFIFMFIGLTIAFIGGIRILVLAFQEDVLWGFGCLFIPILSLLFAINHWADCKKPVFIQLAGCMIMFFSLLVL